MDYREELTNLRALIMIDLMNLFIRNEIDTISATTLEFTEKCSYKLMWYGSVGEVSIKGINSDGTFNIVTEKGETEVVNFREIPTEDLIEIREIFTRDNIIYIFKR